MKQLVNFKLQFLTVTVDSETYNIPIKRIGIRTVGRNDLNRSFQNYGIMIDNHLCGICKMDRDEKLVLKDMVDKALNNPFAFSYFNAGTVLEKYNFKNDPFLVACQPFRGHGVTRGGIVLQKLMDDMKWYRNIQIDH